MLLFNYDSLLPVVLWHPFVAVRLGKCCCINGIFAASGRAGRSDHSSTDKATAQGGRDQEDGETDYDDGLIPSLI